MVGPRNILLALAIVSAIAASSENAAEEQEDHLDALELCLDPFPCRTSPYKRSSLPVGFRCWKDQH